MPTKVSTKVNVTVLTSTILAGIAMLALAGFGFMKTEIEPTIKTNLPGWSWSFQDQDHYVFNKNKITIENKVVILKENIEQAEISNNYPYAFGCYKRPAVGFIADFDNDVNFQISKDNLNWYYWNKNSWRNAKNLDDANSAKVINKRIIDFYPRSLHYFFFKAVLNKKDSRLRRVNLICDQTTLQKFELYPKSL